MSTKLEFKTKKWDKEIINREKVWKKQDNMPSALINLESAINEANQVILSNSNYRSFYLTIGDSYQGVANAYYMKDNTSKLSIDNLYLSGMAELVAELLDDRSIEEQKRYKNFSELDIAVYKLIATGEELPECIKDRNSVPVYVYNGDYKAAKKLLEQVKEEKEVVHGSQYKHIDYLKSIFLAIIQKDEKTFNKEIVNRIKKYRKNMVGYSVCIDEVSIALIKLAGKMGIHCPIEIIEIPQMFFDKNYRIDKSRVKLPFYDEVLVVLQQQGIQL